MYGYSMACFIPILIACVVPSNVYYFIFNKGILMDSYDLRYVKFYNIFNRQFMGVFNFI